MIKLLNRKTLQMSAAFTVGMMAVSGDAHANNFNSISGNIVDSIANLPQLLSVVSYIAGLLLGTLGVLKLKDHVENPGNTPLKDGAIRLAAGGALLAMPIVFEAMLNTIDDGSGAGAMSDMTLSSTVINTGLSW